MELNNILLFILTTSLFYLLFNNICYKNNIEKMSNITDTETINTINELFSNEVDIEIDKNNLTNIKNIRKCSNFVTRLQTVNTTIPNNMIISGDIIIKNNNNIWKIHIDDDDNLCFIPKSGNNWNDNAKTVFKPNGEFNCKNELSTNKHISCNKIIRQNGDLYNKKITPEFYRNKIWGTNQMIEYIDKKHLNLIDTTNTKVLIKTIVTWATTGHVIQWAFLNYGFAYRTDSTPTTWGEWTYFKKSNLSTKKLVIKSTNNYSGDSIITNINDNETLKIDTSGNYITMDLAPNNNDFVFDTDKQKIKFNKKNHILNKSIIVPGLLFKMYNLGSKNYLHVCTDGDSYDCRSDNNRRWGIWKKNGSQFFFEKR